MESESEEFGDFVVSSSGASVSASMGTPMVTVTQAAGLESPEVVESLRFRARGARLVLPEPGARPQRLAWGAWGRLDGRLVLAVGARGVVSVLDGQDGTLMATADTRGELSWGAWIPPTARSADALLAVGGPADVQVWSVTVEGMSRVHSSNSVPGPSSGWGSWSVSGLLAASGGREIELWEPGSERSHNAPWGPAQGSPWGAWAPDDTTGILAFGVFEPFDGALCLYQRTGIGAEFDHAARGIRTLPLGQGVSCGSWGKVGGEAVLGVGGQYGGVWLVRPDTDRRWKSTELPGHDAPVRWCGWADGDDAPVFATGAEDGTVRFWDGWSGQPWDTRLAGTSGAKLWGSWASVGGVPTLATGAADGSIRLWSRSESSIPTFVETVALAPSTLTNWGCWADIDGRPVLATGGADSTVQMWDLVVERSVARRPTYRSDDSAGVDRLSRSAEATALAELLLSQSARPPLAVGLFGEWGEGKSYFLKLLQEQVQALADGPEAFAHHHVRQVKFNAWHYAETDLWASLVAEIFGQLARPATEADAAAEQREQSRLVAEVVATRQLHERLGAERKRAAALEKSLTPPDWADLSSDRKGGVLVAFGANADPDLVADAYRAATVPRAWWRLAVMRAQRVWKALPRWSKWAAPVAMVVLIVALWFAVTQPELLAKAIAVVVGVAPSVVWVAAIAKTTKTKVTEAMDTARSAHKQVMSVIERWQHQVQTALDVSRANIAALEKEISNLTAAGQLAGFVADRAADGSYRQSLGLMTQIREDFQTMATLLMRDGTAAALDPKASAWLPSLDVADSGGDTIPQIDRIVLYIDDLDRCPPRRVVELLEAVHLLLAVPLFVVVVAVDPRWLLRAIALHYREVLGPVGSGLDGQRPTDVSDPNDAEYWSSTPAQYLEKIFQVVFTLPSMSTEGFTSLLDSVIGPRADLGVDGNGFDLFAEADLNMADDHGDHGWTTHLTDAEFLGNGGEGDLQGRRGPVVLPAAPTVDRPDPLALSGPELALIRLLGPPLITTPRSVKRLANSYGLLAAIGRLRDPDAEIDRLPAMVLLAALVGYPNLGGALLTQLHQETQNHPEMKWTDFLTELLQSSAQHAKPGVERDSWRAMVSAIQKILKQAAEEGIVLPETVSGWHGWIALVGRLSFPAGSVAARLERFTA